MATIDIGKIKPVFKGTYDNSTAYVLDDIVYYNGSSYVAKTSTTGNLPTDTTKWNVLASGSGGIWDSTLSIGSTGQVVKVSSGGALEFGTISTKLVNIAYYENSTSYSNSNSTNYVDATAHNITYTPASASNKLLVQFMPNVRQNSGGSDVSFQYVLTRTIGGTATDIFTSSSVESYWYDNSGGQRLQFPRLFIHDDTPNTTSAITYSYKFRNPHSGQSVFTSNDSTPTRWIIWEYQT